MKSDAPDDVSVGVLEYPLQVAARLLAWLSPEDVRRLKPGLQRRFDEPERPVLKKSRGVVFKTSALDQRRWP
jgi:hypothetical protein